MKKPQFMDLVPHSSILMSIKREFSRSGIVDLKFKSLRISYDKYNKDGTKSKVPDVFYPCEHCNKEFKKKDLQVDHKEPVVPVQIPTKHMSWNILIEERCFVKELDQLQLLCKPCHNSKTRQENVLRKEWREKEKHIVYVTTNTVNGKMYIGVHKCVNLNDGYLGSGYALKAAIKKHGVDKFYRKVLYCFDNAKDAYDKEKDLVTYDIVEDSNYYNLVGGGKAPSVLSQVTKNRMKSTPRKKTKSSLQIKVKAINLRTGEQREFDNILDCSKALNLSYAAVLKVCKRRYGMTKVLDWTFETSKYGKSLPAKINKNLGIVKNKKGYAVNYGKTYLGFVKTIEEGKTLQLKHIESVTPENKQQEQLKEKYLNALK